jgi:hypothetical protein
MKTTVQVETRLRVKQYEPVDGQLQETYRISGIACLF